MSRIENRSENFNCEGAELRKMCRIIVKRGIVNEGGEECGEYFIIFYNTIESVIYDLKIVLEEKQGETLAVRELMR